MSTETHSPLRLRPWLVPIVWLSAVSLWSAAVAQLTPALGALLAGLLTAAAVWACAGGAALRACARMLLHSRRGGVRDPAQTLQTMMVLAEHSRRNGIVGMADVQTNWPPLARVCHLVATAAEEGRIREEAALAARISRLNYDTALGTLVIALAASLGAGALLALCGSLAGAPSWVNASAAIAALGVAGGLLLPALGHLIAARNAELLCLNLAFEGALKILTDNSLEAVYGELSQFVPGGVVVER